MRSWLEMNPSTLVLARRELASLRLRGRACRISCVTGRLWVTASERREDFMLAPRQEVTFTGPGKIVVEALRTATVRLYFLRTTSASMQKAEQAIQPSAIAAPGSDGVTLNTARVETGETNDIASGQCCNSERDGMAIMSRTIGVALKTPSALRMHR